MRAKISVTVCAVSNAARVPRRFAFLAVVALLSAALTAACTNETPSANSACEDGQELLNAIDQIRNRSTLPTPDELKGDVDVARRALESLDSSAPPDIEADVAVLRAATVAYGDALAEAGYDLLAAQTQFSTEEQAALYELESGEATSALANLADFVAACPTG